jgi:RND family efflux transporter MFP subunit
LPVNVHVVGSEPLAETFDAGGSVRAYATAAITSRIVAPVVEVKVRAGDRVRAGQQLVVLDARDLREGRAHAEAAALSAVQAAASARGDEAGAEAASQLAEASHPRISTLIAKNSATPAELDAAVAGLKEAEARRQAAAARRLQADSGVAGAHAAARAARIAETYAVLTAPFAGTVTERSVDPGNLATPGVPLLTLEDTRRFRIEASVDSGRAALLTIGSQVAVQVEGLGALPSPGTVSEIHEAINPVSHAFVVKVDVPAAAGLRSGLFGRVTFAVPPRPSLSVPASALIRRGQLSLVYVEDAGRARLRMVHPGATAGGRVAILAGLAEGDRVIVDPPPALADGSAVAAAATAAQQGRQR